MNTLNIKIVGVGGTGVRALERVPSWAREADLIAVDADVRTLERSSAATRIRLEPRAARRYGAGDAEIARIAAVEALTAIEEALAGADLVVLLANLSGATGAGATSVLAGQAQAAGTPVLAVTTRPVRLEREGAREARRWSSELARAAGVSIVLPGVQDRTLVEAAAGLAAMMVRQGSATFDGLRTALGLDEEGRGPGDAVVARLIEATATGPDRGAEVSQALLANLAANPPAAGNDGGDPDPAAVPPPHALLLLLVGGADMAELDQVSQAVRGAHPDTRLTARAVDHPFQGSQPDGGGPAAGAGEEPEPLHLIALAVFEDDLAADAPAAGVPAPAAASGTDRAGTGSDLPQLDDIDLPDPSDEEGDLEAILVADEDAPGDWIEAPEAVPKDLWVSRELPRELPDPDTPPTAEPPQPITDQVRFSVTTPPMVRPGQTLVIDLWAHRSGQEDEIVLRAQRAQGTPEARPSAEGPLEPSRGTVLTARLQIDRLRIPTAENLVLWHGETGNASFPVEVPEETDPGPLPGLISVRAGGMELIRLHFLLEIGRYTTGVERLPGRQQRHASAFACYAGDDRDEVMARLRAIQEVAPALDLFLDAHELRSGERWQERAGEEIGNRDIFYLFWSRHAIASEWVEKEWRLAYQERGLDHIDPVPLEPPHLAPPPRELSHLHFTDWHLGRAAADWPSDEPRG